MQFWDLFLADAIKVKEKNDTKCHPSRQTDFETRLSKFLCTSFFLVNNEGKKFDKFLVSKKKFGFRKLNSTSSIQTKSVFNLSTC